MIGKEHDPGLMFLTIKELFERVAKTQSDKSYQIKVSFLEIYNEMIRDLLIITNEVLELREDSTEGIHVAGLTVIDVDSPEEVMDLLFFGNANRTQEATNVNATSSRSHAVLEIQVEQKNKSEDVNEDINIGKLSMIDLAGSERAARTHNRGIRMVEGAMINRSLLSLGNCINALVENMKNGRNQHIPYRDSKLTRLLKDSLGGNSRTVMIANISPSNLCYEDTSGTLKYANRAKNIKTTITKNIQHVERHISEYTKIIAELKSEISVLRTRLADGSPPVQMIMSEEDTQKFQEAEKNSEKIEEFLEKLSSHFLEETKLIKRVDELTAKHRMNASSTENAHELLVELEGKVGKGHNMYTQVQKELEILNENDQNFKSKIEDAENKLDEVKEARMAIRKQWEEEVIPEMANKLLDLQYEQHSLIISKIKGQFYEQDVDPILPDEDLSRQNTEIPTRELRFSANKKKLNENFSQKILSKTSSVPVTSTANESPYERKKREIDDMIAKRYQNLSKKTKKLSQKPHKEYHQTPSNSNFLPPKSNKVRVPHFGRHRPSQNRKKAYYDKVSTASSKSSISVSRNDFSMLQISGTNINKAEGYKHMPLFGHK
eukprot:CAMPEP_0197012082 /NCGR_PEP_ID=MMETSP1380-20130617/61166_1 /TAXON_ID=5936 /ORGANISM="Euplotes crassus, Strain CT5" /LENGTH=604 /DNA_ID=CAMNT_0042435291 /DNA_START=267 /DNA_END=2082 /DNA_ORIENTATION=-